MPRKADLIKFCKHCNKRLERKVINGRMEDFSSFKKRKYCNQKCMGLDHRKENPTLSTYHKRASLYKKDKCEICGAAENLDVHHKDLNPRNESPENLMTLCDSCHTKWHWEHGKEIKKTQTDCIICGKPAKGHNLCLKHYQRNRLYGNPNLTKVKIGKIYVLIDESKSSPYYLQSR